MPIQGVSDIRRLPRLGKIRLGEKVENAQGKEYPRATDFFVVPDEMKPVLGEKARELDIMIPVDDSEMYFPQWLKRYGQGSGLICKGDGVKATEVDRETGEMKEIDCNPDECEWYQKKHCRRVASLQFMLTKVPNPGVWQIDTTSWNSIVNLNSDFEMVRAIAGRVHGIPLKLVVRPKDAQVNGKKKTVFVMGLDLTAITIPQLQRLAARPFQMLAIEAPKEDEAPDDLYARSVREGPKPTGQAEPKPAGRGPIAAPASSAPQPAQAVEPVEAEIEDPGPADETDEAIEGLFKQLGFTPAKQKALKAGYPNKADLLAALQQQAVAKSEAPAGKTFSKKAAPAATKGQTPPPPPPKTAPRSYF